MLQAQDYHFLQFTDKDTSGYASPLDFLSQKSLDRRAKQGIALNQRDYPVNSHYLDTLVSLGAELVHTTKWLNGALVRVYPEQIEAILAKDFIRKNTPISQLYGGTRVQEVVNECPEVAYLAADNQIKMLGIDSLHQMGYAGTGMSIAVFDDGFRNVDAIPAFSWAYENRIKGTYDLVSPGRNVFSTSAGSHGTSVLSVMAAFDEENMVGAAFEADYYLFVTENSQGEYPTEEINWLAAAEKADSLGVDLINSSLGYYDFDESIHALQYSELDGDQAIITRAADFAASVGIIVVTSVGNEGTRTWRKLIAPADADSVLSVGAVSSNGTIASFSSYGPAADGRVKPDVLAQGSGVAVVSSTGSLRRVNGTSFSAPMMAGMAACLWQAYPNLTNMEVIDYLRSSGSRFSSPDDHYGYGIPTFSRFASLAGAPFAATASCSPLIISGLNAGVLSEVVLFPNPSNGTLAKLKLPTELIGTEIKLRLYDLNGRLVFSDQRRVEDETNELVFDGKLSSGVFLLSLQSDNASRTFRVLVE